MWVKNMFRVTLMMKNVGKYFWDNYVLRADNSLKLMGYNPVCGYSKAYKIPTNGFYRGLSMWGKNWQN